MKRRTWVVLALALAAAACDSGPKGPGTLNASVVTEQSLGAVVLDFTGGTVTGFEGQGDTRVFSADLGGVEPHFRVILVSSSGGQMQFGIKVSDQGAARPTIAAVTAASPDNVQVVPGGLQIKIAN